MNIDELNDALLDRFLGAGPFGAADEQEEALRELGLDPDDVSQRAMRSIDDSIAADAPTQPFIHGLLLGALIVQAQALEALE